MPILLKSIAGMFAGIVIATVSLSLWLPEETRSGAARPLAASPLRVAGATTPAGLDRAALATLALAMGAGSQNLADPAAASTRGLQARSLELRATDVNLTGPDEETLRYRAQGLVALAGGDVAEARAFLERAADAGDARALLVLGDTYDPTTLARLGAIGIKGDVARARDYYARARQAGLVAARPRLAEAEIQQ